MKKLTFSISMIILTGLGFISCHNYLDIVPEGVPSMDNAFSNRINAKKFLYTCYSYLPSSDNPGSAVAFLGGDECWLIPKGTGQIETRLSLNCWEIGRGSQNSNNPYMNFWDGLNGGNSLWIAIHDCNIFLENIHKPKDLQDYERERWIAEVTFLKAYYHFYLLQLYGPIPITDVNIPVNSDVDKVRVFRDPVDSVVNYIVRTMDKAAAGLEDRVEAEAQEAGRITKTIVLAQKAKILAFAASPLMNGNSDYANMVDSRGIVLFPTSFDIKKWQRAAQAAKEAIECAKGANHRLYRYTEFVNISNMTRTKMSIRNAVCDLWNEEIIWGSTQNSNGLQTLSMPKLSLTKNHYSARSLLAPTLRVAEQFYSANGVPIEEDNSLYWQQNYEKRYEITTIPDEGDNKYNLEVGSNTVRLHLNREPRFYATLGFDRGTWYSSEDRNDTTGTNHLHAKRGEYSGIRTSEDYSITGYFSKKVCNYKSALTENAWTPIRYAFPIIRLADLYLLYAEARNESLNAPDEEIYNYIDSVRTRAGLKGVVESWTNYSRYPDKVRTKEGMREIIRKERLNELALEGQRFWDLRRWKIELPSQIQGWNCRGNDDESFYRVTNIFEKTAYHYRDFLWPIRIHSLQRNPNLKQNPGW